MNKQNRFFRHKGLAGALAMVAVILAVAFAAGYHLPDAAAKKGKETAALTETQKQMPQKAPEPAISPEKAKEADRKESISLDASKSYHIIVEKKAHRLSLLLGDTVVRSYGCAIGKGGLGQKQRRGDNMTPVGTFTVDEIDDASSWPHDFGDGRGEIAGAYGPWFISLDTEALSGALGMALGSMEPMILKVLGRMHLKDVSVFTTKTFRNCVPSSRWALSLKLKTKDCALLLARQIP